MPKIRKSNELAHRGQRIAPKPHRAKKVVRAERAAKAQAKADSSEEAKKQPIVHAAEFEHRHPEDLADAASKPPHSRKKTKLIPVAETSDVEMIYDVDNTSDNQPPSKTPSKAQIAGKATANTGMKVAGPASDEDDEEQPQGGLANIMINVLGDYSEPLLTLDPITLFYWTLSHTYHEKQNDASAIKEWALAVPATAEP